MIAAAVHDDLMTRSAPLLRAAGVRSPYDLIPLPGGTNNRVFRVDAPAADLVLKAYFHHPHDPRDRLGAEFAFASFAWRHGLHCLPEPVACDPSTRLALYRHLPGDRIEQATPAAVRQAVAFYLRLNALRDRPGAEKLPVASEACFSLAEHLRHLQRRIDRLADLETASPLGQEAGAFVGGELAPACAAVLARSEERCRRRGLPLDAVLPRRDRSISPSDFGFHNALRDANGNIRFLDFEYAGWDDPAKTVCDFFCQPACPVPRESLPDFIEAALQHTSDSRRHRARVDVLLPVYELQWCCILLNDFLPAGGDRRRFALAAHDHDRRRTTQLPKARLALARHTTRGTGAADPEAQT